MAEPILRLKVESKEYDAKIKRATDGLLAFEESCHKAGKAMDTADKETVDYVRKLGTMETVSRSAKGSTSELSRAFIELSTQYKRLTDQEKASPFGKALSESINQLRQRTMEAKQQLSELNSQLQIGGDKGGGGGGLFGGKMDGMLQVMGGNLMTKGVELAASAVSNLAGWVNDTVTGSIELAKEAEGVRMAFERLDRPGLLDNVREATHGTIDDLEIMKQAVKFENFGLNLDQMGTLLAFAQQQAKDTGESIDYLVDSIVTGLGRQSLPILDNLGLSATEIRKRMKDTGDMTTAVSDIIKDRMAAAGDYVETAGDRAAKAEAEVKNAMLELGNTMLPLEQTATAVWHNIEVGAINLLNNAIKPLIQSFTELGRVQKWQQQINGGGGGQQTMVDRFIDSLKNAKDQKKLFDAQLANFDKSIAQIQQKTKALQAKQAANVDAFVADDINTQLKQLREEKMAVENLKKEYYERGQKVMKPVQPKKTEPETTDIPPTKTPKLTTPRTTPRTTPAVKVEKTESQLNSEAISKLNQEYVTATEERRQAIRGEIKVLQERNAEIQKLIDESNGKVPEVLPEGSVAALNKSLSELKDKQKKVTSPEEWKALATEIEGVQKQIDTIQGKTEDDKLMFSTSNIQDYISEVKKQLETSEIGSAAYNALTSKLFDANALSGLLTEFINNGIDMSSFDAQGMWYKIFGGEDIATEELQKMLDTLNAYLAENGLDIMKFGNDGTLSNAETKKKDDPMEKVSKGMSGLQSVMSGLQQTGLKIPTAVQETMNVMQGLVSVIQGVQTIISIFSTTSQTANTAAVAANTAAVGALTFAVMANTAVSAIPFRNGGIVPHAANGLVAGHDFSDNTPVMVSSGELILNRAQQGNLASQLEGGGGLSDLHLETEIRAEKLRIMLNANSMRRGKGEYVTSKSIRD